VFHCSVSGVRNSPVCVTNVTAANAPMELQLVTGYVQALESNGDANNLKQSSDLNNSWNKAFVALYHPVLGVARGYEKTKGQEAVKNFKKKTVKNCGQQFINEPLTR